MSQFTPAVYKDGSYTCIVVSKDEKTVKYIPMATLAVESCPTGKFEKAWSVHPEYPVRRAAELYLGCGQYRQIPPQAREHLRKIADKSAPYSTFDSSTQGTSTMASKKPSPAAAANPFAALAKASTPVKTPAKAAPAKVAPAHAKAAVKAAPAKAAPAPAKAAVKAAPAKTAAKPAAKATAPAGGNRSKIDDATKYKVVNTDSVKRGFLLEFVEAAQKLKTFTRPALETAVGDKEDYAKMRTYFPYAVSKGIFAPL